MGTDKAILPIDSKTCLEIMVEKVAQVADDVWVARRHDQFNVSAANTVYDLRAGLGPLAGLEGGLLAAKHPWTLVVPTDAPFVRLSFLRCLVQEIVQAPAGIQAIVPIFERQVYPLLAVYHISSQGVIRNMLNEGRLRMMDLLTELSVFICEEDRWKESDPDARSFQMMNTKEDYERVRAAVMKGDLDV